MILIVGKLPASNNSVTHDCTTEKPEELQRFKGWKMMAHREVREGWCRRRGLADMHFRGTRRTGGHREYQSPSYGVKNGKGQFTACWSHKLRHINKTVESLGRQAHMYQFYLLSKRDTEGLMVLLLTCFKTERWHHQSCTEGKHSL